jgi:hypothetical protein
MPHQILGPESDLFGIDPNEQKGSYRPHTTHTHYFGFHIPEEGIGCYSYVRWLPYFPLMQGNVMVFQGTDNHQLLDMAHLDYEMTCPWPEVDGNMIKTTQGYRIEFLELGRKARVTYTSTDGRCSFELEQTAISPLCGRAAVLPGEDLFKSMQPGGSEQFMHCVGELKLHGHTYPIDCKPVRDRSWNQDRSETRRGRVDLPISWTSVHFDEDLYINQVGFEQERAHPSWKGYLDPPPEGYPGFLFAWVGRGDDIRDVVRVEREVTELHPTLYLPLRQEIEIEDERGEIYRMTGEALAHSPIVGWPHAFAYDSVYRWETDDGRIGYGSCQGIWYEAYQHAMKEKRLAGRQAAPL